MSFFDAYHAAKTAPPNLCVGIDPAPGLLARWGLDDTPDGLLVFARALLEAAAGQVAVVKPQVAYFERFGPEGYRVLSQVIAEARERGLLVIADAKRGDIDSTMEAYGQAWLGEAAPLRVNAITANPYLGLGSLEPLLQRAAAAGAYVFVVARSSNPEGASLQGHGSPPVWRQLLEDIAAWSRKNHPRTVGAVVGATVIAELEQALTILPQGLFLAPGIGKQGASLGDLAALRSGADRVLASASRSIAEQGPDIGKLKAAIAETQGTRTAGAPSEPAGR